MLNAFLNPKGWWTGETPPRFYGFDPDTGEYLCAGDCDPSPLEPGVWLDPGHSTRVAPPEHAADPKTVGYVHRWADGEWELVRDRRGEWVYVNGQFRTITTLGAHPEMQIVVHDAQYLLDPSAAEDDIATIRMWVNDDVIEFRDDPNLPARVVLAAWEAMGETIRPVDVDIETVEERDAREAAEQADIEARTVVEGAPTEETTNAE